MEIKRKGIIFALDAALAVTVVIIILINSSYYFSTSSKESLSQLQPVRIGSDVIALLDFGGNIEFAIQKDSEADIDTIPSTNLNVSDYLPQNYAMRFGITDMKETPTNKNFCDNNPQFCERGPGVDCPSSNPDTDKCILDTNEWIKIKPAVITSSGYVHNIKNQGYHFVSIGTTAVNNDTLAARIKIDGNITAYDLLATFDKDTGIYFWGTQDVFYFEAGNIGDHHWIEITNRDTDPLKIKWVRVVGDESYMRYGGEATIPIDRFVGSGERFVTASESDGDFLGYYLVRYWVWLNSTIGG